MEKFIFHGKVLPEREALSIPYTHFRSLHKDLGIDYAVDLYVDQGLITALVELAGSGSVHAWTFKVLVEDGIRAILDTYGYVQGKAYDVDVSTCVEPSGKIRTYGVGVDELEKDMDSRPLKPSEIISKAIPKSEYVALALADLRESIRSPHSAYFGYRALESIRQHFYDPADKDNQAPSWQRLRGSLNIDRSWIQLKLQRFAEPQRHGSLVSMSNADIVEAIRAAWSLMDRFCVYLINGEKPLDATEYPTLK